jgi:Domain of unknown function (DUF397)
MTLEQDLASIAEHCEILIRAHEYDPNADACACCGEPWACYTRLTAEDLLDGLRRLPLLDQPLTRGTTHEGVRMNPGEYGWRRSSFSDVSRGNCVEVKATGRAYAIRDSQNEDSPILVFSASEWLAFTQGVRAGEFD